MAYTEEQRAVFIETASEIGITRAQRKLGYPESWASGKRWMEAAGIEVPLDEIKAQAKAHHDWYQTEDLLLVGQEQLVRIHLMSQRDDLSPDDAKKLAEAYQKVSNVWLLLQGKANSISETHHKDSMDVELMALYEEESKRTKSLDMEAKS